MELLKYLYDSLLKVLGVRIYGFLVGFNGENCVFLCVFNVEGIYVMDLLMFLD